MSHFHSFILTFLFFLKYDINVDENEEGMLILRIPVEDKDAPKTPNSEAVFRITEGNEDNHFRIETDPVTNEGLLYVAKVTVLFYAFCFFIHQQLGSVSKRR